MVGFLMSFIRFLFSRIRIYFILDPGSASKNLSNLNQKKFFLSSRKYDPAVHPGSGSRIRLLTFYPSRIPDPGVKKARDPQHCFQLQFFFDFGYPKWGLDLPELQLRIRIVEVIASGSRWFTFFLHA